MNSTLDQEQSIQREYYERTAAQYDEAQLDRRDEHYFALNFLRGAASFYQIGSILDIGAGTGRVARFFGEHGDAPAVTSVEPVAALREQGHRLGLPEDALIDGDATNLAFPDNAFDLACEFAVLHHLREPRRAVSEMLRVSRKGIFISDSNNFGQGGGPARLVKQALDLFGLWPLADRIKTKGKGYTISEEDGLAYSYSVFNELPLIRKHCKTVHILNTRGKAGRNLYRTADHIAILALKAD
jgi:ubiquinone/menaquinone biosynthesis C-methylase UbiE